ncbi:MAG TPA: DUF4337 domain-containing protein [bacterium]|nr:DUF4337 domain-containing protein [bacterium]
MGEVDEAVQEITEEAGASKLTTIALLVTLTATFLALCGVKAGNVGQAMDKAQASAIDGWAYYQSKSTKQNIAEAMVAELTVLAGLPGQSAAAQQRIAAQLAGYREKVARYETEKKEIEAQTRGFEQEYAALNYRDDQFDLTEALLSMALALFGVTALTKKRWLLVVACIPMVAGLVFGLAGYCGWAIHSDWFAVVLG